MKGEHKIILFAAGTAVAFWFVDSALGFFVFHQGMPFWDLFLLDLPPHELYVRAFVAISFLAYGTVISVFYRRQHDAGRQLRKANEQLRAGERQLTISNRQLLASEQQLRAANEQFEAANEQLAASESALRAERDRAQKYLDVAAVMLLVIDTDGEVALINAKGCEILRASEREVIGKKWVTEFIPERLRDEISARLTRILNGDMDNTEYAENLVLTADGKERMIAWHNALLKNDEGELTGVLSSGTDITEQKEAEARGKALNDRLARAERMESLGVLAGGVAHDLNNILGSIVTLPDIMLDDINDLPPETDVTQLAEDIATVRDTGKTAAQVIRDLLTLSRRGHYHMTPLNVNKIVESYLRTPLFQQLRDSTPCLDVRTELADGLLPVAGSESHLTQVLMNLVANAVEAMPHGGGILIRTSNVYVKKHAIRYEVIDEGEYVSLSVSDAGAGISDPDLERVFEPFYTKKVMGRKTGTGLGLSVVYGVTKDHSGYVDVKSIKGHGSEFIIYLPVTRETAPEFREETPLPLGSETVLVVDDVPRQRKIAQRLLKRLGYRATLAASGEEAVDLVRAARERDEPAPFDLIMLDMILEDGFDGLDTYKAISRLYPGQKCIIVSGYSETGRALEAESLGAGRFLAKPYTLRELARTVRDEIDRPMNGGTGQ